LQPNALSRNDLKGQMDDVAVYNAALFEAQTHAMRLAPLITQAIAEANPSCQR
jgi:hypothetical protein